MKSVVFFIVPLLLWGCFLVTSEPKVYIRKKGENKFELIVEGESVYIKGIGGTKRIDVARKCGANFFRTWGGDTESIKEYVSLAAEHGMFLMQGISLPNHPGPYQDSTYRKEKKKEVRDIVHLFKDDPNILIWSVGNEIELGGNNNTATSWAFVEELVQIIKSIDSRHLVATVISHRPEALDTLAKYSPSLDLIGINSYGSISEVEKMVLNSQYNGPYVISEWGPTGWWENLETDWGAPIEQTSEEKRVVYEERYKNYIANAPACLGSFVFLWGQKEERTPTWFSMFVEEGVEGLSLNGEKTPMVEAMERVWNDKEPEHTAPVVIGMTLNDLKAVDSPVFSVGENIKASVEVEEEAYPLTFVWEVLEEATILGFGGSFEPRPERVGASMETQKSNFSTFISAPGNYRLYVYVLDGTGYTATANVPFQIK